MVTDGNVHLANTDTFVPSKDRRGDALVILHVSARVASHFGHVHEELVRAVLHQAHTQGLIRRAVRHAQRRRQFTPGDAVVRLGEDDGQLVHLGEFVGKQRRLR